MAQGELQFLSGRGEAPVLVFTGTATLTAGRRDKAGMPMFDPAC